MLKSSLLPVGLIGVFSFLPLIVHAQAPTLAIERVGGQQIKLSWPESASSYVLELAPRLTKGATWSAVSATPVTEGVRRTVTMAIADSEQYFRLRGPAASLLTTIANTSPVNGEAGVSVNRETVLEFSAPLAAGATVSVDSFHAEFGGRRLLSRVELSSDRRKATLFSLEPIPAGARVNVRFIGDGVLDARGQAVDADGNGTPGGTALIEFDTFSAAGITGTAVIGHVYASEPVATGNGFTNRPLQSVLITVDGAEDRLRASTDVNGFFQLEPCPSGRFFVHIDGRPAVGSDWPAGAYYPYVGKTFEAVAGYTNNLAGGTGEIFLPLVKAGTLQAVSLTQPTTVTFPAATLAQNPALAGVSVTVPANALFADDGTRGGQVGIAPVDPNRLPSPLPPGLNFPLVITVQTDGPSNFDGPVPVRFPNLPDPVTGVKLAPGAKSALWSYDHDTGRWEIQGSMTVTADGNFVETDPGVGIRQPGWHGSTPGSSGDDGGGSDGPCSAEQKALELAALGCSITALTTLAEVAPGIGCGISLDLALLATLSTCTDPNADCAGAMAYNGFFGVTGCIPLVGLFTGGLQCAIELGGAIDSLLACQASQPSSSRARVLDLARQAGAAVSQQQQLSNAGHDVVVAILGDDRWLVAAEQDVSNTRAFVTALVAALDPTSDTGTRISAAERASLLGLPAPGSLPTAVRAALLDRFDRFASAGMTASEKNAIQLSSASFSAISTQLQNQGWVTMFDGLEQAWREVTDSFGKAAASAALQSQSPVHAAIQPAAPGNPTSIGPLHQRQLLYRLVDQATGLARFGKTEASGQFIALGLAPDRDYILSYLDPVTLEVGSIFFTSGPAGGQTHIPRARLVQVSSVDSDQDGLTDLMEGIVGTNPQSADSDNDGTSDLVEVQQGQNPLDGLALPEGVVASLPLSGRTLGIHVEGSQAFLATGPYGFAMADVSDPLRPVNLGQIDLPGGSYDVTYSPEHQVAGLVATPESFVAGESGLVHFVDTSDPGALRLKQSYSLPAIAIDAWDGLFFVALGQFQAKEVRIYDPASALELGWFAPQDYPTGLRVTGGRAYVATQSALEIYDVTLARPALLGRLAGDFSVELLGRAHLVLDGTTLFVSKAKGIVTIDVSDPKTPKFIGNAATNAPASRALALNGGGRMLALTVGTPTGNPSAAAILSIYDVTDPANLGVFQFSLNTPGRGRDLALLNGFALVADDLSGLTVVNYAGVDLNRQAPVITFDPATLDLDSARAGIQVAEGSVIEILPHIQDDVQLDRIELLVNGTAVDARRSYPATFRLGLPTVALNANQPAFGFQLRAVDRSGNATLGNLVTLELVRDTQPPVLLASVPAAGGAAFSSQPLVFRFNEWLDPVTLNPQKMSLLNLGADGAIGGGDDAVVSLGNSQAIGATLILNPAAPLAFGKYQLTLKTGAFTDRAGNTSAQDLTFDFNAHIAAAGTAIWISDTDGQFDDPTKWLAGRVPSQDDVLIQRFGKQPLVTVDSLATLKNMTTAAPLTIVDRGFLQLLHDWVASEPVDMPAGTLLLSGSALFEKTFSITGGRVETVDQLDVRGKLTLSKGGSLTLSTPAAKLLLGGGIEAANFTLAVTDGAVVDLNGLTTYDDPGDFTGLFPAGTSFFARGSGSHLTLSELTAVTGPVNWNVRGIPSVRFGASDGGILQLPKLATLAGRTQLTSSGFNGVLNAPLLASVTGPDSEFIASIDAADSGEVQVPSLTLVTRCNITLENDGVLRGGSLELADNSSVEGVGTVAANLLNHGSILLDRVPGNLIINGKLDLTSESVVNATLGLGAGRDEAGRIETRGDAVLNGTLRVSLARGYTPAAGQQFELGIFAKPPAGAFAQLDDSSLGATLKADLVASPQNMKVSIATGP